MTIIKRAFNRPKLFERIRRVIGKCLTCKQNKHDHSKKPKESYTFIGEKTKFKEINELVCIDIYGPLPVARYGLQYVLVIVDLFSKYVKLKPLKVATSSVIINVVEEYIKETRPIKSILSDNGTQFTSNLWKTHWKEKGVTVRHTSPYTPSSNPAERIMGTIGTCIRIFSKRQTMWPDIIKSVEMKLNSVEHESTKAIPYKLMGKENVLDDALKRFQSFVDENTNVQLKQAIDNFVKAGERRRKRLFQKDPNAKAKWSVGTTVFIKNHFLSKKQHKFSSKLAQLYKGPFTIIENFHNNCYRIRNNHNPEDVRVANINQLKIMFGWRPEERPLKQENL